MGIDDETFSSVTRKKECCGSFGFFLFASEIEEKSDNGFGDKNTSENSHENIAIGDFVNDNEVDNEINNEENNGGVNFGAENERKRSVVGFFGTGFTKSVMIKN